MITETLNTGAICEWCDGFIAIGEPLVLIDSVAIHPDCLTELVHEYVERETIDSAIKRLAIMAWWITAVFNTTGG